MATADQFQSSRDFTKTVTILDGQTESDVAELYGASIIGILTDANVTGTSFTFKVSTTYNGSFVDYKGNDATPAVKDVSVAINATTAEWYGLNATDFAGVQYAKLVAGTAQSGSDTTITLICRGTPA